MYISLFLFLCKHVVFAGVLSFVISISHAICTTIYMNKRVDWVETFSLMCFSKTHESQDEVTFECSDDLRSGGGRTR